MTIPTHAWYNCEDERRKHLGALSTVPGPWEVLIVLVVLLLLLG